MKSLRGALLHTEEFARRACQKNNNRDFTSKQFLDELHSHLGRHIAEDEMRLVVLALTSTANIVRYGTSDWRYSGISWGRTLWQALDSMELGS